MGVPSFVDFSCRPWELGDCSGHWVVICEWVGHRLWAAFSVRGVWAIVGGFGPWLLVVGLFVAGQDSVQGWRLSFWAAGLSFGATVSSFVAGIIVGVPHPPIVFEGDVSLLPVVL